MTTIILGIIFTLIGVILLGFYNALLLKEGRTLPDSPDISKISKQWHMVGAAIFLYISIAVGYSFGWKFIPFSLSCFLAIFAGIVHKLGLGKSFFFVGTTAKTDQLLQKWFPNNAEKGSAILKISMLVVSIALIIFL